MQLRAVLMAGGSGTRLRPLTCELPKPMVPAIDRPIAEHIINLLKRHQITEIVITLHYLPEAIQQYFGDGSDFGVKIHYAVEADRALGTAGCVKNVEEILGGTFVVISGDSLTDIDLSSAIEFHQRKGSKATIVLAHIPNPIDFGVVIVDETGRIRRFLEKPSASEVFSDAVNTGIYILEPEVLDYLHLDTEADFSQDLFPQLLAHDVPMYGYVADGYWCDIGQLDIYRESQYDALRGKVKLDWPFPETSPGIRIGANTYVDPTAKIEAPVVIGANCKIGPRVTISGETIIGDNVAIGRNATLKRPIVGSGSIVGEDAQLRGCVLARGVRIGRGAQVLEGAVLGALCNVGEEAQINPNVRVWPNKEIEPLAILNINLIWGQIAHRNLFAQRGVQGLANIDITPEFAVKLGAAYGSTLKQGSQVTVSRDQRNVSRMVSRSLIAGLMSVGIDIQDLEATAIPVSRKIIHALRQRQDEVSVVGGIHVRLHPDRVDSILIEFFDDRGINISTTQEKKIESAYFKEDLRRARIPEIGDVNRFSQGMEIYKSAFQKQLDLNLIRHVKSKVVVDYAYAVSGAILPLLLSKFGCDAVVLNASLNQMSLNHTEREALLTQLGHVVVALKASFGVQVSAHGEQMILVDEEGVPIRGDMLTALMVQIVLTAYPGGTVVVPVQVSSAIEQIVRRHGGKVKRTKASPTALMEACQQLPNVVLGGSGEMGFIFPEFHPGFDAMFCIAKTIEMLAKQDRSLSSIRAELPRVHYRTHSLRCPWTAKGGLMRYILETHQPEYIDTEDGVKIVNYQDDRWVLILPDAGEPMVHIYVNGNDRNWVDDTLREYRQQVQDFIERYRQSTD
jgi:mannose-1-phosphate guanylyltransferase / phosphomannomutase